MSASSYAFWIGALLLVASPVSWWFKDQGIYPQLAGKEHLLWNLGVGIIIVGAVLRVIERVDENSIKAIGEKAAREKKARKRPSEKN